MNYRLLNTLLTGLCLAGLAAGCVSTSITNKTAPATLSTTSSSQSTVEASPLAPTSLPTSTTTWTTLTDSQKLFSLQVPSGWNAALVDDTPAGDNGPGVVKDVDLRFPDGTVAFVIGVFTPSGWQNAENSAWPPQLLRNSSNYVFGYIPQQYVTDDNAQPDLYQVIPHILASFSAY